MERIMGDEAYSRVFVTNAFIEKVLKPYTDRLKENEAKKNGQRKIRVTKRIVCQKIIEEMQEKNLI